MRRASIHGVAARCDFADSRRRRFGVLDSVPCPRVGSCVTSESPLPRSRRTRVRRGFPYPGLNEHAAGPWATGRPPVSFDTDVGMDTHGFIVLSQVTCCRPTELRMRIACIRNPERLYPAGFSIDVASRSGSGGSARARPGCSARSLAKWSRPLRLAPGPFQPAPVSPAISHRGDPRRVLPSCRCDARNEFRVRGNGRTMGALVVNLP